MGGACDTPVQTNEADGGNAAGQAHSCGDLSDGADLCVLTLVTRHEQDAILLAHVGADRYVHVRKDDGVVKRNQKQRAQSLHHLS